MSGTNGGSWIDDCLQEVEAQCKKADQKDAIRLANDRIYEAQIGYFYDELWELWTHTVESYNKKVGVTDQRAFQFQTLPHGEFSVRRFNSPSCHLLIVLDRAARMLTCAYSYVAFRGQIVKESKRFFVSVEDDCLFLRQVDGMHLGKEEAAKEIFSPFFKRVWLL